jgi:hypothetical protein
MTPRLSAADVAELRRAYSLIGRVLRFLDAPDQHCELWHADREAAQAEKIRHQAEVLRDQKFTRHVD